MMQEDEHVINCKITGRDETTTYFETTVTGNAYDTLAELMRINCEFVRAFRKNNIPEELIEKQLVNCVLGGFSMADEKN